MYRIYTHHIENLKSILSNPATQLITLYNIIKNITIPPTTQTYQHCTLHNVHHQYGHISSVSLNKIPGIHVKSTEYKNCPVCNITNIRKLKHNRKPIDPSQLDHISYGEQISIDISPNMPISRQGNTAMITIVDRKSGLITVSFAKNRNHVNILPAIIQNLNDNYSHVKVTGTVTLDNELYTSQITQYLKSIGYNPRPTVPGDSASNFYAERSIGTLRPISKASLRASTLNSSFLEDAYKNAAIIANLIAKRGTTLTPYDTVYGTIPFQHTNLIPFGTKVIARKLNPSGKYDDYGIEAISLYPSIHHIGSAYCFFNPKTNSTFITNNFKTINPVSPTPTESIASIINTTAPQTQQIPQPPSDNNKKDNNKNNNKNDKNNKNNLTENETDSPELPIDIHNYQQHNASDQILQVGTNIIFPFTNKNETIYYRGTVIAITKSNNYKILFSDKEVQYISHGNRNLKVRKNETDINKISNLAFTLANRHTLNTNERNALKDEIDKLNNQDTFKITHISDATTKPINSRFLFKTKADNTTKSRYVFNGSRQIEGVHFQDTTSPVASKETMRLTAILSHIYNLEIGTIDFVGAYLNTPLDTDNIYINIPKHCKIEEGKLKPLEPTDDDNIIKQQNKNYVLQAKKCINGGKQCAMLWYQDIISKFISIGFKQIINDPCLLIYNEHGLFIMLDIFVDDAKYGTNDNNKAKSVFEKLPFEFRTTTNQPFVGMTIEQHDDKLQLHQKHYIKDLITKYNLDNAATRDVPFDNRQLPATTGEEINNEKIPFQTLLGELQWVASLTRPDISYHVNSLAQYTQAYTKHHFHEAKNILRYLKGTIDKTITATKAPKESLSPLKIEAYVDASYGMEKNSKSRTGFIILINGCPVQWGSKKQSHVASSSTHAEYLALSTLCTNMTWLLETLRQIPIITMPTYIPIHVDNQPSISTATNLAGTKMSKAIRISDHYSKEFFALEPECEPLYVKTSEQAADILTKPVKNSVLFNYLSSKFIN